MTRQFLASLCPDALLRLGRVELAAGGEAFSLASLEIVEEGWCAALPSAPTRRQPPLHDPTCPGRQPPGLSPMMMRAHTWAMPGVIMQVRRAAAPRAEGAAAAARARGGAAAHREPARGGGHDGAAAAALGE